MQVLRLAPQLLQRAEKAGALRFGCFAQDDRSFFFREIGGGSGTRKRKVLRFVQDDIRMFRGARRASRDSHICQRQADMGHPSAPDARRSRFARFPHPQQQGCGAPWFVSYATALIYWVGGVCSGRASGKRFLSGASCCWRSSGCGNGLRGSIWSRMAAL